MEKNEEANPWSTFPSELEDILLREVFPILTWDDITSLSVCKVNKAWRALFTKNSLWKTVLQQELPFVDLSDTIEYYKKFCDSLKSFKKFGCPHPEPDASTAVRVCPCMIPLNFNSALDHAEYYTGNKAEFILKPEGCKCHEQIPTREYLQFPLICKECNKELRAKIHVASKQGMVGPMRKYVNAFWIHNELKIPEELLVAKPLPNSGNMIAITQTEPKKLVLLKVNDASVEQEDLIECTGDTLQISNDGKYVAVYTRLGTQGFVYNLHDKKQTFNFERGSHYPHRCSFPVAFFTYDNKEYLIAGKAWNRIDLYDPETGESLKERDVSNHRLEFFWCSLHVSPDQKSLCSFGWVWHPIGEFKKFSIEDWMTNNIYAMESRNANLSGGYDWDYPLCWIDNNAIALWGDSSTAASLWGENSGFPVVRPIEVPSSDPALDNDRKKYKLFTALEESPLVFDEYLISLNPKGIEVVDVNDGHVLDIANKQQVDQVLCYNKYTKQVLSIKTDNPHVLVVSHIHYYK